MKRLWIVLGLLVVIVSAGLLSIWHLSMVTKEMEEALGQLSQAVAAEDPARLAELSAAFEEQWEKNESVMMRYIHHDELDSITGTVARLKSLSEYGEFAELSAEVDRLRHLILHIYESELPTLENIF